jgi:hypothetical protein
LKVEIPKPGADRPELGRVGVIAAVGFIIGIAWPWLSGVRLVPSPPNDEIAESLPAVAPSAGASSALPAAPPSGAPGATDAPQAPAATEKQSVKISDLKVTTCRGEGNKKLKDCDKIQFDPVARGRLAGLARCGAAEGAEGTLSIGFDLDFEKRAIIDVFAGKSTTFSREQASALIDCAKKDFAAVTLDGIDHEHARYTAFYFLEFLPPGAPSGAGSPEEQAQAASGLATVAWDVAVVRDAPEDGKIVTRLRYGTRVVVAGRKGRWYEVRYDAKGQKGWVHRNALGL